ncbi:MAG: hypothetical protein H0W88_09825 [Parachlamydiaceae bacterium]|nr:hypothetical protein [Parachlamydiaceae bacterium]
MTKKSKLNRLMIAGMATGLLLSQNINAATDQNKSKSETKEATNSQDSSKGTYKETDSLLDLAAETGGNVGYHLMTEDELMIQLNDEGAKLYKSLSPEGKKLALSVASRSCNGTNECIGLNACATKDNSCAGKGKCKGQTKCAISDPNFAVKLVANKMAKKREDAQNNK